MGSSLLFTWPNVSPLEFGDRRKRQSEWGRGFRFANVPQGKASNVTKFGSRIYGTHTVVDVIQRPTSLLGRKDKSGTIQVVRAVSGSVPGNVMLRRVIAPYMSGSVNIRRSRQRNLYNKLIRGEAFRSDVGEAPIMGISSYVPPFTYVGLASSYTQQPATVPSWTQAAVGKKHAFVISTLSSSDHEVSRLNAYVSGIGPLEQSPVPASASMYYSKASRFVYKVYKLSASANLPVTPGNEQFPSADENVGGRGTFDAVSGSYRNNSIYNPSVFAIDVPDYGKIRDIRVWVEFVHDHRGGAGSTIASGSFWFGGPSASLDPFSAPYLKQGLQGVQVALRSPNVFFKNAHPLWNDPQTFGYKKRPDNLTGSSQQYGDKYQNVPELLRGSYLLWSGHACEDDLGISLGSHTSSKPDNFTQASVDIDSLNGSGKYNSIAIDPIGNPAIAFSGVTYLKYATYDGTTWFTQAVDVGQTGSNPSLKFDKLGIACIAYDATGSIASTGEIKYARSGASSWTLQIVDVGLVAGQTMAEPSLAFDPAGIPHITYKDAFSGSLKYASSGSSGWTVQIVDIGHTGGQSSLAFDIYGNAHVAYCDSDAGKYLKYARLPSGSASWGVQVVDSPSVSTGTMSNSVLVLDSKSSPHISYRDNVSNDIRHAFLSGTTWTIQTIQSGSVGSSKHGFVLDSNDNPRISYQYVRTFVYKRFNGTGWITQQLDYQTNLSNFFGNSSLALVPTSNQPHFSYWRAVSQPLSQLRMYYATISGSVSASAYFEYDTDIDMRTVFTDSSTTSNPRHLTSLYSLPVDNSPGSSSLPISLVLSGKYPSPLSSSKSVFGYDSITDISLFNPIYDQSAFLTGANFPWMLDDRIPPGNFVGRSYSTDVNGIATSSYSVPTGWLTNGVSASVNEFPTKGMQLGPTTIRPVYPLLDDVYVQKIYNEQPSVSGVPSLPTIRSTKMIGFRPGLRGTEVNGRWQLLIGVGADFDPANGMVGNKRAGIWFRQFRLEFLLDQGHENSSFFPSKSQRFKRPSSVPSRSGHRRIEIMSGSSEWDIGINYVYTIQPEAYGRSVGITSQTGSSVDTFAVFSRITGSLADSLSGSGQSVFDKFLNNEFGTPFVPLSSGSAISPSFQAFDEFEVGLSKKILDGVLNPKTIVSQDPTIRGHLSRASYSQTTAQRVQESLSSGSR